MAKPLALFLIGVGALLAITNPGQEDFREFAGKELSERAVQQFCRPGGLPMVVQMVVHNCPELIRAQQKPLGVIADRFSRRMNLGLLSVYNTEVAGGDLLPQLALPGYELKTIAIAGQFFVLNSAEKNAF
jgi:hypothetical protein